MKRTYEEIIKSHKLPDLKQWLSLEDELTERDIRLAFAEKLGNFTELVYVLTQPEEMVSMSESALFSEEEHENLQALYNKLVLLSKDSLLVDIESTPEEEAELVIRFAKEWPAIITQIKAIINKTKEAYSGVKATGHDISYLG